MSDEVSVFATGPQEVVVNVSSVGVKGDPGVGAGIADGDMGGIVISGGGTIFTVKAGSITDLMLSGSAIALFATAAQGALAASALQPGALIPWADLTGKPALFSGAYGDLTGVPATFTPSAHTHVIGDVTGLQGALDGKQPLATVLTNTTASFTSAQETKLAGIAAGATVNASDAALRDRATHTGTQAAATISDFASAVAATAAVTANTAKVTNATHTGDVTGSTALTIANDAVSNANLANMATATIKGRATAGTGDPEDLTATQATALLDTFTSGAKGLVPASGGGTANFLRADGTFAAPAGGSPGGATGEVQYNNGGSFAGAADVEIEGGQLRLPAISTPLAPASAGLKLFGRDVGGRLLPAAIGPSGLDTALQPFFGRNKVSIASPPGNNTAINVLGFVVGAAGTATQANVATTNRHTRMKRLDYLVTTASTSAVVGMRGNSLQWSIGAATDGDGGFFMVWRWGPATGVATSTHRCFVGFRGANTAPTDVNPSTLTNICGMGYDNADTNIQFMHNDGAGSATKIDLGAAFPKPDADRTSVYEIALFAPPGTTQSVSYAVTNLITGDVATGTVTADLPATGQLLMPYSFMSVGGTSSVIGMAIMSLYVESDY